MDRSSNGQRSQNEQNTTNRNPSLPLSQFPWIPVYVRVPQPQCYWYLPHDEAFLLPEKGSLELASLPLLLLQAPMTSVSKFRREKSIHQYCGATPARASGGLRMCEKLSGGLHIYKMGVVVPDCLSGSNLQKTYCV